MRKQRILEIIQRLAPSDAPRGLNAEEVAKEAKRIGREKA
jgi:hypothetical protein